MCVCACPLPACLLRALAGLFSSSRVLFQPCLGSALSVTKRGAKFLLHSRGTTKIWRCSGTKWRGHHMIPVMHHFLSPCNVPRFTHQAERPWRNTHTQTGQTHKPTAHTYTGQTHISTEHRAQRLHTPTNKNTHNGRTHTHRPAERGANGHTYTPTGHWPLSRQRKSGSWMATFQYNNIKVSTKIFVTFYFTVHCISGVYWFKKKHGQMIMIHLLRSIFKSTNMYHVVWSTVVSKCVAFQPTDRAWNRL